MKKLLWTSAMALTAAACMTACDDSSSGASNSIPEFKTEAALPDTCEMEVAKAGDTYFACFENKWIEVTDSATVEQLKEGLDEDEVKAKLEELEDLLKPTTPAKPKSSSSKKTDEDVDSSDSDEPESSASEECTGRRCNTDSKSSSSKKSSGGSGSGEGGEGGSSPSSSTSGSSATSESASSTESKCGEETFDPLTQKCKEGTVYDVCGEMTILHVATGVCVDDNYYELDEKNSVVYVTDGRDGNVYKSIVILDIGKVWFAENLRFDNGDFKCFNGTNAYTTEENEYCNTVGRFYTWYGAIDRDDCKTYNASSTACKSDMTEDVQGICPVGWHVASLDDFNELFAFAEDYDALRSKTGWMNTNGTDLYGINVLPYCTRWSTEDHDEARFWSSTEKKSSETVYYGVQVQIYEDRTGSGGDGKGYYNAVRCVMDQSTIDELSKYWD